MENKKLVGDPDNICANVDVELAGKIAEKEYGITGARVSKLNGFDDLNFHVIPSASGCYKDDNGMDLGCNGYVLKIINWRDSENIEFFTEYVNVLRHLRKERIPCPLPIKNRNGEYSSYWIDIRRKSGEGGNEEPVRRHLILLLTYQDGQLLADFKCDEKISYSLGCLLSKLQVTLQPFSNSEAFKRTDFPWALQSVPQIRKVLKKISLEDEKRKLVLETVTQFEDKVLSKLDELEKGVIHGDINDMNVLVQRSAKEDNLDITGVIDFADMLYSTYLFDIAITVCYIFLNNPDDCDNLLKGFLLGYDRRRLTDLEYRLLKICICARLCQSVVMGLYAHSLNPTNQYVLSTQKEGWNLLLKLSAIDNEKFAEKLRQSMNNL